ncbi:golgin subfamily A member 6-like protein 7 [Culex pipiens pallens]|uniref:golgin subfamily A member 6-like protein 7 n=1 Tax=Culex pipiens pallens TaxID=42434 RepID=UPI00195462E3|nr:golgin subfamily A member 6-like protein 7 [Culex pipiens pallens]
MNVLQDKIISLDRRFKSKNVGLTDKLDQIADLLKKLSAVQYKLRLEKSSLEDTVEELRRELEAAKRRTESLEVSESMLNEVMRSEKIAFEEELSDAANRLKFESKVVEISVKEAGLSLLESQLAEKAEQLRDLSNERDELVIKCSKLKVVLKDMTNILETQKQSRSIASRNSVSEEVKSKRDSLTEQFEELTESVTVLEEDRDTLREEMCRLEAECKRVDRGKKAQCGKLLGELARKNEVLQDYDTLNEDFMSERDAEETLFDEKQAVKSQLTAKEKQLDIVGN